MNSHAPISTNPASRIGVGQIALGLAAAWFCVHAAIYAVGMCRLDSVLYRHRGTRAEALLRLAGGRLPRRGDRRVDAAAVGDRPRARRLPRAFHGWCCWRSRKTPRWLPRSPCCCCGWPARCRECGWRLPGRPASDTRPGASRRPPSTRRWCRSASSWASSTRSLRRSWPPWPWPRRCPGPSWLRRLATMTAGGVSDARWQCGNQETVATRMRPESEFGRRVVLARSDLGDSGGRVHRRQHQRSRFRLRCACICPTCCG